MTPIQLEVGYRIDVQDAEGYIRACYVRTLAVALVIARRLATRWRVYECSTGRLCQEGGTSRLAWEQLKRRD